MIKVWSHGADLWEGMWKDEELHGFSRHMNCYWEGGYSMSVGYWKNGLRHGYGKTVMWNHENPTEGLMENDMII